MQTAGPSIHMVAPSFNAPQGFSQKNMSLSQDADTTNMAFF
jgi:hypothetical protein